MHGRPDGLLKATLTLLAGGALAQAVPLLLGPWLTRLYTPGEFGHYTVFAALAANLAVVACARYDFALPLARDDDEARDLMALCLRVLVAVTVCCVPVAWVAGAVFGLELWAWLPAAVAVAGLVQCLTLWHVPREALSAVARRHREFPLLNTPHAFAGALQDTLAVALLVAWTGEAAAGFWGLALRYLKAPATLVGGAVSQALYPKLAHAGPDEARRAVRQVMGMLALVAVPIVAVLLLTGPALFAWLFGERWRPAGELARALAPYIGVHFIAAPLAVVTLAWRAQGWALKFAFAGQCVFLGALAGGLHFGGLQGGAWAVSAGMTLYFGAYFWCLATWKEVPHGAAAA